MWWSQSQNYGHTMCIAVKLYRAKSVEVKMRIYSRKLDFLNKNFFKFYKKHGENRDPAGALATYPRKSS